MTKIYADTANLEDILVLNNDEKIKGFTTNPTLMKTAGVENYEDYAKEILSYIKDKPISFEVLADDCEEMKKQAIKISKWGDNVYVKIPITDTKGKWNLLLMQELSLMGIKINATAITTYEQIDKSTFFLDTGISSIISVFAGRIADTGRNPLFLIKYAVFRKKKKQEILWASSREIYNFIQALDSKVDIITMTPDILKKMKMQWRKSLEKLSLETVQMFYEDAKESGLKL